ncbi:MAG: hypothetical protein ACFE8G_05125 [Candidatus Hermodarchaeota archaeon]
MMPVIRNRELKRVETLKNNWKLKEALKYLNDFDKNKDLSTLERFQFYFLKSSILIELFNSGEAMKYAELAHEESKKLESDYQIIKVLLLKLRIFASLLDSINHLKMITDAEKILARNNQKSTKEFRILKGHVLLRKGTYYLRIGDFNKSLMFLGEVSQLAKELNDKKLTLLTTKWLGFSYSTKGESNRALEYEKRYLASAIKLNDKQEIIGAHNALGMEFTVKGEINKAIEHLEKGLSLCYEIKSWKTFIVSDTLFNAYIELNSLEKAQHLHDRMGELVKKGTWKFNEQIYRLQKATLLKKKLDETSLSKAEVIFKDVADKEVTNVETKIYALVNLCDIYLTKLKETGNLKELDKTQPYIDKIRSIAENEEVYTLLIEMYILQAKLKLISFEFKEAQEHLTQALDVAHKHELNLLVKKIEYEQTELSKNFIKWEHLRKAGGKLSERMDLARIDEQIQIILQKRNYLKGVRST